MIPPIIRYLLLLMITFFIDNETILLIRFITLLFDLLIGSLPLLVPVIAAIAAVAIRFLLTRIKLKRAIKSEVYKMNGIERCADAMRERENSPTHSELTSKEVPRPESIPTKVYEENIGNVGLLTDVGDLTSFYTDVIKYKKLIREIRNENDVPQTDQQRLYDNIEEVENKRQKLFGENWIENFDQ